jgi:hypothetical protein
MFLRNAAPYTDYAALYPKLQVVLNWLSAGRPRGRISGPCKGKYFLFSIPSRLALGPTESSGGSFSEGKTAGA